MNSLKRKVEHMEKARSVLEKNNMVRVSLPLKVRTLIEQVTGQPCEEHHLCPTLSLEGEKSVAMIIKRIFLRGAS